MNNQANSLLPDVLALIRQKIRPQQLNTLQEEILSRCWRGSKYSEIAEELGYDTIYVRYVGSQLWQQLSSAFGEKVAKSNFRAILNQQLAVGSQAVPSDSAGSLQETSRVGSISENVSPISTCAGTRSLSVQESSADVYIERPPIEARCYKALQRQGALIRIKAPKQMGKTALLNQVLLCARQYQMQTVIVSLRLADADIFANLDRFLQWFCAIVCDQLDIEADLADQWKPIFGSNYNCTHYFSQVLLPQLEQAVVIALDDVDVLFQHPAIAADVLGLLRAWCEKAKHSNDSTDEWYKLRLVVIHSTEVYIPLNQHQSPFNIGLSIELPEFTPQQVTEFAKRYELIWSAQQVKNLIALVGGKPNLIHLTLEWIASQGVNLETVLSEAVTAQGIYYEHLRQQFRLVHRHPALILLLKQVMTQPEPVKCPPLEGFQLESLGLVKLNNQAASPSCELYRQYLGEVLK